MSAAVVSTTAMTASVLVGCENENEPEYWIKRLEDAKWRPKSVERLTQFFDDALTKAEGKKDAPTVAALEDKIVVPLTNVYVENYDELDTKTRVNLIKLLADFRDERAVPALKKAFEEFAKRPRETKDEQDIKWAVRAYGDMGSEELAGPVLAAFEALEAHTQLGGITYKDYSKAMVEQPHPSWEGALLGKLDGKIKHPNTGKNPSQKRDLIDPYRDELFWQVTAAQVLGELKSEKAVEPLIKVVVNPSKGDVATTALLALVKIGKPSIDRAVKVLDEDDEIVKYAKKQIKEATEAKEEPKGNPVIGQAAAIIGMCGRSDGIDPIVAALEGKLEDADKALLARELPKMPATEKSKAAFKKAFESISLDSTIQGTPALMVLAESAAAFYDPEMIDWMLERAKNTKGGGEAKAGLQQTLVTSAIKVSTDSHWEDVTAAAKTYKVSDLIKPVEPLVKKCHDNVECYLTEVESSKNQTKKNQLAGIKSAYMIGVLGDAKARDALVERLPSLENGAIHFTALQAIDHLSPKAAPEVVEELEAYIEKNEKSADADKLAKNQPLKQVANRISVR